MIADDLTPNAIKLRDILIERIGQFSADSLATLVDLAESNLERFAVLTVNGFDADVANELLKSAGYLHLGRFSMCAHPPCNRVIGPKSFVVARGAALFCSTGCFSASRRDVQEVELH